MVMGHGESASPPVKRMEADPDGESKTTEFGNPETVFQASWSVADLSSESSEPDLNGPTPSTFQPL
jgi:hypothetical protein